MRVKHNMFALEQEVNESTVIDQKIDAMRNVAQFRDELFAGNQGKAIKVIGGVVVGMFFLYRFLMK